MRLLIVSEGHHELRGALETIVRRLARRNPSVVVQKTVRDPEFRTHGAGDPFTKRAVRCVTYAEENGYDALVFLIDADGDRDRRRQVQAAQEDPRFAISRAMG